jgi:tyrosine-specific transport protein
MQKQTGAILLVAGTCIGSGMIALPLVLARIGLLPSVFIMLLMWAIIYYTALINLEINLQAGKASSLGELGRKFSGKIAELIGTSSFKILSFSLVAVYIYGGSSVLQTMMEGPSFIKIASIYALISTILLILPIKIVDYVNRALFMGLLGVISILVAGLVAEINWTNLPLFASGYNNISSWVIIAPIVFTAFGFHGSLPTLINYCNNNQKMLKNVFLWGCFIPSMVYIIWTCSILSVIHNDSPALYQKMTTSNVEVGELIKELSLIVDSKYVQLLVWWISLLAIVTSLLGVGISLCETIRNNIESKINNHIISRVAAACITILPAYLMAIWIPNAFISVLGFAGMILVIIAILLPIYLLKKAKVTTLFCKELKDNSLIISVALIGIIIILCEIMNMLPTS